MRMDEGLLVGVVTARFLSLRARSTCSSPTRAEPRKLGLYAAFSCAALPPNAQGCQNCSLDG